MRNLFIGIIAFVVIIGGVAIFLLTGKNTNNPITVTTPNSTISSPTPAESSAPAKENKQNTITLNSENFSPKTLTIKVGDTVTWINRSGRNANVSSNPHPIHTDYTPLNLGSFPDGGTLSLTFDKAGTYGYHNHLNPSQNGTIVVE
jgi:plastocyanin